MDIIIHRVNKISDIKKIEYLHGVEVDVRYYQKNIILNHDPFHNKKNNYDKLDDFIREYKKKHTGKVILNIKSEGIEKKCIKIMNKNNFTNWFFLDLSMPYFVKYANISNSRKIKNFSSENLAVRFSEFEPIEYAISFSNKAKWVWVDCFKKMPLNKKNYNILKKCKFKICLVAPELQKHKIKETIKFQKILKKNKIKIDAVCTKRADLWKKI